MACNNVTMPRTLLVIAYNTHDCQKYHYTMYTDSIGSHTVQRCDTKGRLVSLRSAFQADPVILKWGVQNQFSRFSESILLEHFFSMVAILAVYF